MAPRRSIFAVVLAFLAACGNDTTGPGTIVATVRLTPADPTVDVGLTVQFAADPRDANNVPVSGLSATWTSSNTAVATISPSGLATASSVGTTAITATVAGVSGSQVLIVEPSNCAVRIPVALSPGEHETFERTDCIFLPSGLSGDRYRVALVRPTLTANASDVSIATLEAIPLVLAQMAGPKEAPPASPSPERVPASARMDGTPLLRESRIGAATARYHRELHERALRLGFGPASLLPHRAALAAARPAPPAGRRDMNLNLDCQEVGLSPVVLIHYNDDLEIFQDSVAWAAAPISTNAATVMADYYSSHVKGMIVDYWGDIPDIDGNGRITVVTAPVLADSIAAAVYPGDLVSQTSCSSSNQGEVVYFNGPYMALIDSMAFGSLPTLAHETKHVVSLYNRIAGGGGLGAELQPLWVEEGTAEISGSMSSRVAWAANGGPAVGARVTGAQIVNYWRDWQNTHQPDGNIPPELWGVVENIANSIVAVSTQPNSLLTNPQGADDFYTFYAASWHFFRFMGDAFGDAAGAGDGPFFRALTAPAAPAGTLGLQQQTGEDFVQLFEDLIVAMSLTGTAAPAPALDFTTYEMSTATDIFSAPVEFAPPGIYPWPVTTTGSGAAANPSAGFVAGTYTGPIGPSGIRIHDFVSSGVGAGLQLTVNVSPPAKLIVTRLR